MSDEPAADPRQTAALRTNLEELARLLHRADHLDPEAQQTLADLVAELGQAVQNGTLEPSSTAHLADSTGHLVQALRDQHQGLLATARERLQRAAALAEAEAPVATGFLQ